MGTINDITPDAVFSYGPSRVYAGRITRTSIVSPVSYRVEVQYSTGTIEELHPTGISSNEFAWGFTGPASIEVAVAILSHAISGKQLTSARAPWIDSLARAFASEFLGQSHAADVEKGFDIPGEMVLLWVLKRQEHVRQRQTHYRVQAIAPRRRVQVLRGSPRTLHDILGGYRKPQLQQEEA